MAKREEWINNKRSNYHNQLGDVVDSIIRPVLPKFSKIEADLLLNWHKIFDSKIADKIKFEKLSFTDKKNNRFILHIKVLPKDLLEITHSVQIIQEQLNLYLGYNGVEKVRVHK